MADFDAAHDLEQTFAVRRRVAGDHIAQVGDFRFGQVATEIGAGQVHVDLVGATGKVSHHSDRAVGDDADARLDADRTDKARDAAQRLFHFVFAGEAEGADALDFAGFDFIEFVIPAQEQQDQTPMAALGEFRDDGQRFDEA